MNKTVGFISIIAAFGLWSFTPLHHMLDFKEPEYQKIIQSYKTSISNWPTPDIDKGVQWKEFASISPDVDYFKTQDLPEVQLGKMLFFDPKLSKSNQVSCSTCHDPEIGWSDKRRVAVGSDHLLGIRNSPSLLNIANREIFFWDGRASSLEEQAHSPIAAHNELAMDPKDLPLKLSAIKGYQSYFKNAYGDSTITMDRIVKALASFQRTIKSQPSRVDKFIDGNHKALNDQEIYGMHIFRTKGRCMNCHHGPDLTDDSFHNIGLTYYKRQYQDLGRFLITDNPDDVGKFKTPSLRDLLNTRPWMHNGLFDDLEGIVNLYNSGMHMIDPTAQQKLDDPLYPVTDSLLKPLELTTQEKKSLVAFLEALSGTRFKMKRPEFPTE